MNELEWELACNFLKVRQVARDYWQGVWILGQRTCSDPHVVNTIALQLAAKARVDFCEGARNRVGRREHNHLTDALFQRPPPLLAPAADYGSCAKFADGCKRDRQRVSVD